MPRRLAAASSRTAHAKGSGAANAISSAIAPARSWRLRSREKSCIVFLYSKPHVGQRGEFAPIGFEIVQVKLRADDAFAVAGVGEDGAARVNDLAAARIF